MQLEAVLPNLKSGGLSTTGFLFGAGTSVEAGYPMMPGLTRSVVNALTNTERAALDEVMAAVGLEYNAAWGDPNIEVIADHVIAHAISSQQTRFSHLEARLRELITEVILDVQNPSLDNHVAFLDALKRRAFSQPGVRAYLYDEL